MFGFDAVAAFTHHVETAFDLVRRGEATPTRKLIALALAARDHMRLLIDHPDTQDTSKGDAIIADLNALMAEAVCVPTEHETTWRIRFKLPKDAMATGTNPLLLLDELRALGTAVVVALADDVPPLDEIDPATCYLRWDVTLRTAESRITIEQVFLFVMDDMELLIEENAPGLAAAAPAGGAPEPLQALPPTDAAVPGATVPALTVVGGTADAAAAASAAAPGARGAKNIDTIRVPAERLDDLMERVGELVIAQSRLKQIAAASNDPAVKSVAEEIERLSLELRDTTMGVRMLPIGSLFGRFRRLIHDLARDLGKEIELVTVGEETELDKTVIETAERSVDPPDPQFR